MKDYYSRLGVSRKATLDEVRAAYRKLAREFHPDLHPGDKAAEDKFKEISEAYDVLSDDGRRSAYDRNGQAKPAMRGDSQAAFEYFRRLFEDIDKPRRGSHLRITLPVSAEGAKGGTKIVIELVRGELCGTCRGTGTNPGSTRMPCALCHGAGKTRKTAGAFSIERTCIACMGHGSLNLFRCDTCRGSMLVKTKREIEISVPAGVEDGQRLRLAEQGEHSIIGGKPGDLFCDVKVIGGKC